jgi:hypothetical protein
MVVAIGAQRERERVPNSRSLALTLGSPKTRCARRTCGWQAARRGSRRSGARVATGAQTPVLLRAVADDGVSEALASMN